MFHFVLPIRTYITIGKCLEWYDIGPLIVPILMHFQNM